MSTPARIGGHPIHPMFVPLAIGLWVFSLVCDLIHRFGANRRVGLARRRAGLRARGGSGPDRIAHEPHALSGRRDQGPEREVTVVYSLKPVPPNDVRRRHRPASSFSHTRPVISAVCS